MYSRTFRFCFGISCVETALRFFLFTLRFKIQFLENVEDDISKRNCTFLQDFLESFLASSMPERENTKISDISGFIASYYSSTTTYQINAETCPLDIRISGQSAIIVLHFNGFLVEFRVLNADPVSPVCIRVESIETLRALDGIFKNSKWPWLVGKNLNGNSLQELSFAEVADILEENR